MKYDISAACGCVTGRVRNNNEDNILFNGRLLREENNGLCGIESAFYDADADAAFFGVFDGMGGVEDGQVASHLAALTMLYLSREWDNSLDPVRFLRQCIEKMNQEVRNRAEPVNSRMGTTAVLCCVHSRKVYVCNVGDSRAYRLHKGRLTQISKDHTDAKLLKSMNITNRKPRLSQYIGLYEEDGEPEASFYTAAASRGDRYLLCSDGITDMVPEADIENILNANNTPETAVKALIETAMENGGRDNATAMLICINRNVQDAE